MQSPYAANSDTFYAGCDKTKTSVIKVDDVSDVLEEAAPKVRVNNILVLMLKDSWASGMRSNDKSTEPIGYSDIIYVVQF